MQDIKKYFHQLYKKLLNYKYKREIKKEKSRLFITDTGSSRGSFKKRNTFQFFKTKLEFYNENKEMKHIEYYYFGIGLFLILGSLYVVLFSHYFSIKTIDILQQDQIVNLELAYKSIDQFRYQPIILTKKEDIARHLLSHQPNLQEIIIKKNLPNNVKIMLTSYDTVYQFKFDNKTYLITGNGTLIPKKAESKLFYLEVKGLENFGIIDYKKYFDESIIQNILKIHQDFSKDTSPIKISSLTYYKKERELHVRDDLDILYIFDLDKDIATQTQKLNVFFKEYRSKIKQNPIYVDLRIKDRIIFCGRESEYQCKLNLKSIYD